MKIGVLALQGDFYEHQTALQSLGVDTIQVRLPEALQDLNGLIIPGGESTTIGKLAVAFGLMEPLKEFGLNRAIWGTCAGAIFLSKTEGLNQPLLGLMNITIERNAFGAVKAVTAALTEVGEIICAISEMMRRTLIGNENRMGTNAGPVGIVCLTVTPC